MAENKPNQPEENGNILPQEEPQQPAEPTMQEEKAETPEKPEEETQAAQQEQETAPEEETEEPAPEEENPEPTEEKAEEKDEEKKEKPEEEPKTEAPTEPKKPDNKPNRKTLRLAGTLLLCVLAVAVISWLFLFEKKANGPLSEEPATAENATAENGEAEQEILPQEDAAPETEAAEAPLSEKAQAVMAKATSNATKDLPTIVEPSLWKENGKAIMESLCADSYYQSFGMTLKAKAGYPYLLAVNRAASTVTVYTVDQDGNYTNPFMAMVCSGGEGTPLGYWATPVRYDWHTLTGPCYGQYSTRIYDCYLFHSVPYYTTHQDDLEYDEFNELGTPASLGCIRLAVVDVKWIYDSCPIGTPVVIYDDEENPGPMGKPGTIYIDPSDEKTRGWDPTDPNPENPWPASYRTGTAIRSDAAWEQWDELQQAWAQSINPSRIQGWSHDSAIEGTRG